MTDVAMFTDNTALFRARVKAIKLRQNATTRQRVNSDSSSELPEESLLKSPSNDEEQQLVSVSPNFTLYSAHARQICQHICELADLVLERRKSYLLTSVNVYGHDNFMTDEDRRQFDADTDLAMKQCSKLVRNLEFQVDNDSSLRSDDEHLHLKAVTLLLNVYLNNVCKIVAGVRAVHLKKTQYLNKICRLGNLVSMYGAKINSSQTLASITNDLKADSLAQKNWTVTSSSVDVTDSQEAKESKLGSSKVEKPTKVAESLDNEVVAEDEPAELAEVVDVNEPVQTQLTLENQHLFERFIQRNSEIEQIETQFAELQRLQQTFVEKVIEQEKDIEIIHEKTIHTLDNLEQANEFIREAIKNSASRRVIALFCLIVLTFTLLFLDWYNP